MRSCTVHTVQYTIHNHILYPPFKTFCYIYLSSCDGQPYLRIDRTLKGEMSHLANFVQREEILVGVSNIVIFFFKQMSQSRYIRRRPILAHIGPAFLSTGRLNRPDWSVVCYKFIHIKFRIVVFWGPFTPRYFFYKETLPITLPSLTNLEFFFIPKSTAETD